MRYRLLLPLLAGPALGFGQSTGTVGNNYTDVLDKGNSIVAFSPPDAGVQGSPLLLRAWTPAAVLLRGNTAPKLAPVKYDVVHQQLRVRRAQGDSVVVPLGQVQEFTLTPAAGPRRFVPLGAPGAPTGFAEVLSPGPHLQLLKLWDKTVEQAPASNSSYAAPTTTSAYADRPKYYLRGPSGQLTEVRPKRASLQAALAAYPTAQQALKARKGSLSTEAELRDALAALDALVP
ncbi:hypothetical protein [Hymenobacter coccineus]|uniref:Uncharacterized protein n=1 Tax=Hymenobacter coccineus TaxID=1908235 RepID=A0A1G1T4B0_9BACT|nr:hypothetical protein [Hymenobacter coccineus]OGX85696.1 hypothetical protein BEN49_11065 [Hymenobacter coccineus]